MKLIMCACVVSVALGVLLLGAADAQGAFVGTWVLDPASSTGQPGMSPTAGTLEIKDAGGGKYTSVS